MFAFYFSGVSVRTLNLNFNWGFQQHSLRILLNHLFPRESLEKKVPVRGGRVEVPNGGQNWERIVGSHLRGSEGLLLALQKAVFRLIRKAMF